MSGVYSAIMIDQRHISEEIVRRGKELYEQGIRQRIDPGRTGEILAIDVDTGDFEVDRDHLTAALRLRARRPDAAVFAMRVGFPALGRIGFGITARNA